MFPGVALAVACYSGGLRTKEVIARSPGEGQCWRGPTGGSREQKTQPRNLRNCTWGERGAKDAMRPCLRKEWVWAAGGILDVWSLKSQTSERRAWGSRELSGLEAGAEVSADGSS